MDNERIDGLTASERMDIERVSCVVPVCEHEGDSNSRTDSYRLGDAIIAVRLDGCFSRRYIYEVSKDSDANLWSHDCEQVWVRLYSNNVRDLLDVTWLVLLTCGVVFMSAVQVAGVLYEVPVSVTLVLIVLAASCCFLGFHLSMKPQWSRWYGLSYTSWRSIVRDMQAYVNETHDAQKTFRYVRTRLSRE